MPLAVLAALYVNGATDAPNSVAAAVSRGVVGYRRACLVCALFDFAGMLISCLMFDSVAKNMVSIADFCSGGVVASLLSVVIFSSVCWRFGIPTSESHGLIAAVGGSSLYYAGSLDASYSDICLKSVLSCVAGLAFGAAFCIFMKALFKRRAGKSRRSIAASLAFISAGGSSFCHGMQDGQKFLAMLAVGTGAAGAFSVRSVLICSVVLAAGCFTGGKRIINKLGCELTGGGDVEESSASDMAALVCTVAASLLGIPVSTTYMKTCTLIGASLAAGRRPSRLPLLQLVLTWAATYPVCMALSYALSFGIDLLGL